MKKPSISEIKIELGMCAVPPCQPNDTGNLLIIIIIIIINIIIGLMNI